MRKTKKINPFEIPSDRPLITAPVHRSGGSHEHKRGLATSFSQLARGLFDRDRFAVYGPDGDGTALEVVTDRANGVTGQGDCFDPAVRRQQPRDYREPGESGDGAWSLPVFGTPAAVQAPPPATLHHVEPQLPMRPNTRLTRLDMTVWRRRPDPIAMPAVATV